MSPSNRFGRPGSSATPAHVRSRNARRRRFPRSRRSRHEVAHRVHAARTVGRRCDERSVGRRQRDGVDAAVGRLRIHPRFHCGDPSAECALREVPMARGAGKVHRVREAPEIIQPLCFRFDLRLYRRAADRMAARSRSRRAKPAARIASVVRDRGASVPRCASSAAPSWCGMSRAGARAAQKRGIRKARSLQGSMNAGPACAMPAERWRTSR
ncbi:hypothetical protein AK34_4246 [Burkholderia dolosa AU0158]|nr:hypothetical protein AK34_4246 [Burkholderia dolosa AU0158]VWB81568.1 hypothetical protein BDO18943_03856 [Burkholderia dolosa]